MGLPTEGIQYLVEVINANTALQSLAAKDAAALGTNLATVEENFLVKRTRYILGLSLAEVFTNLLLYINAPSATSAETEAAIEATGTDPDDFSAMADFMARMGVIWSTIAHWATPYEDATNVQLNIDTGWLKVGGKKGIPYGEGIGPELHCYNMDDSALPADVVVNGLFVIEGVWLKG